MPQFKYKEYNLSYGRISCVCIITTQPPDVDLVPSASPCADSSSPTLNNVMLLSALGDAVRNHSVR